ncbi:hypothetical protein SESBI_11000 [Sesbania bispinosa]|nr:hypothetical protein SESBI_11000 [Sesbania bispinosa]
MLPSRIASLQRSPHAPQRRRMGRVWVEGGERSGSCHELPRVDDLWFGAEGFVFGPERGKCETRGWSGGRGARWIKGEEAINGGGEHASPRPLIPTDVAARWQRPHEWTVDVDCAR